MSPTRSNSSTKVVSIEDRGDVTPQDPSPGGDADRRLAAWWRGVSRISGAIAHDVRGPLNNIGLDLELLSRAIEDVEDPDLRSRQRHHLEALAAEVRRLHGYIETLLGEIEVSDDTFDKFDLRAVVAELERLIRPFCMRHRIELRVDVPENPVILGGNRGALKQALLNLVVNALEAMPDGGTLELSLGSDGRMGSVRVSDTGPGLPQAVADRPFALHETTKHAGPGAGLYVACSVVDSHGGRVRLEPQAGRGARIEIEIPIATQD